MERLAILVPAERITAADIGHILPESRPDEEGLPADAPLRDKMAVAERALIVAALEQHGWRMAETARALGLERSHLYKKLKAHGLERPPG